LTGRAAAQPYLGLRRPYPRDSTVHELFAGHARRSPDAVALITAEGRVTYGELDHWAGRIADRLRSCNASPAPVGLYVGRGPAAVAGMLGILRTDNPYLPMDPADPVGRSELMQAEACGQVVLTTAQLAPQLTPGMGRVVVIPDPDQGGAAAAAGSSTTSAACGAATGLSPAYIMYTSGSTGVPKGVCVPHRAIVRLIVNTDYVQLGPDEVILHAAPLTFDGSTFEIWGALLNGAALVIMRPGTPSLRDIADTLAGQRVTTAWLPSVLFREVVRHDPAALAGLRHLITGGDVVTADTVRAAFAAAPDLMIVNGYGPTEATTFSCAHPMTAQTVLGTTVPIGRPIANTAAYVLDEHMVPLPPGVPGELYIGGDGVALGYVNDPDLTGRMFVPDPYWPGPHTRLYRTGDRAVLRGDGNIDFCGRIDRQIKIRGYRVELGEVEAILARHPSVADAVAVPWPGPTGDLQIAAYVTPSSQFQELPPGDPEAIVDRIGQWRRLYDHVIYAGVSGDSAPADAKFNTEGWKSSYTGLAIPEPEMLEQVDQTVARILESQPRSVLEIGCGTGLLLFRLRPHCERYVGTDFSKVALDYVRHHLDSAPAACRTSLVQSDASDLSAVAGQRFDIVVLNSVVQHFPTADYLRSLLVNVMDLVPDAGLVFLGDLRSRALLPLFHLSVLLQQVDPLTQLSVMHRLVAQRVAAERELAVDPGFFPTAALPRLGGVRVDLKRGHSSNEMTKFRYDVTLTVGVRALKCGPALTVQWGSEMSNLQVLDELLGKAAGDGVGVRSIPNRRCELERRIWEQIQSAPVHRTLAEATEECAEAARAGSVDPEQLWALGGRHGVGVRIGWSAGPELGFHDATFGPAATHSQSGGHERPADRGSLEPPASTHPWRRYANNPMAGVARTLLATELRRYVAATAPAHIIPAAVTVLDRLPVGANGKIDLSSLPEPERVVPDQPAARSASGPTAAKLATILEQLLGIEPEMNASLFELGGNSLTVIQLVGRIEDVFGIRISPVAVFQRPTVAGLAQLLESQGDGLLGDDTAEAARQRGLRRRFRAATRRPSAP
jgi:amino acid adenylation domain-containing protein